MFLVRTYYQIKPFIPLALRLAFRRWRAQRRKRSFAAEWPINPIASTLPNGWKGWPEGKKFALVLTHDVEGSRGLEQSQALADLEKSLGVRSAFNFVPEGEYRVPAEFRHHLVENGFEVGVHDLKHDGKLYWSRSGFRRCAQKINQYLEEWDAVGFRSGFMHHNLDWIHDLEVLYDSSTFDTDPFEPQPDGVDTIFPFWVPGPEGRRGNEITFETSNRRRRGYVELPYTLSQDFTLFLLLQERGIDIWKRKLDWVADHGGMAMIDVHPDYMDMAGGERPGATYPVARYREFIQYAQEKYGGQYWPALPKEVAQHFLAQLVPREYAKL